MSINDLLNDESLIPALIILVIIIFTLKFIIEFIVFIFNSIKNYLTDLYVKPSFEKQLAVSIKGEFLSTDDNESQITININNNSNLDILAIEFYVEEFDIYGKKIEFEDDLCFVIDTPIESNCNKSFKHKIKSNNTTKINFYFFSIYYNDNTYWGNKKASKKVILEKGYRLTLNKNYIN